MLDGVAARLKECRNELSIGQGEFAKLGGVSKNSQSAYEQGRNPFNVEYLLNIADHGVDIGYIVTGERTSSLLDYQQRTLLDLYGALSARERQAVTALMKLLAGESVVVGPRRTGDMDDEIRR